MLTRGIVRQQSATARKLIQSQFHTAPRLWLERLLCKGNPPKGFGKFYPGGKAGGNGSKTAENTAKTAKPSGGSGGGGKKSEPDPDVQSNIAMITVATTFVGLYIALSQKSGTEISWREFSTTLLESGEIDRVIIVNKTTARVVLKSATSPLSSVSGLFNKVDGKQSTVF
jgi:hypothetical protein